jgi:hypothetical protein
MNDKPSEDEAPHEDFRHASTRHFRARAREMGAQDVARLTEQRTTGLDGLDARTMTRTEFENLKDQLRGGRRAGLGSEAISNQLREERNRLAREAFERGMQNRRD